MSELLDLFLVVSIMVAFGISILVSDLILTRFEAATDDNVANQTILAKGQTTIGIFDLNFAFVLIGVGIMLFVTAFLVNSHPVFLPLNLIIYIILIFISALFSNVFITFAESDAMITTANEYTNMIFIWRNLPFILTIMAGVNLIVMFAKIRQTPQGGAM